MKKSLVVVFIIFLILFLALVVRSFAVEPYDSMTAIRPVPRPTEWPAGFLAATPEAGQPDAYNETNYWALWWAVNERVDSLMKYQDQPQKIWQDNPPGERDEWVVWPEGSNQFWMTWPVAPLVFYWSIPVPIGIVTQTVVATDDFFGDVETNIYTMLDFTNVNTVVTHLPSTAYLPRQTNVLRVTEAEAVEKKVVWGDWNYGEVVGPYAVDVYHLDFWAETDRFTRVDFEPGDPHLTNMVEDVFLGTVFGAGVWDHFQLNSMDKAIRELVPYFVNHVAAPDLDTFLATSTGPVYQWKADRDGAGPEVPRWVQWAGVGDYPEAPPMWTLDTIGAELVSQGVGTFMEFPKVVTNSHPDVEGWTVGQFTTHMVPQPDTVDVDLQKQFCFTLWKTNWWTPVALGKIQVVQTNLATVEVTGMAEEFTNGTQVVYDGEYSRTGMVGGKALLTGPGGKTMWWASGSWWLGPDTSTRVFQGPDHDVLGTRWAMVNWSWLPEAEQHQGTPGVVDRVLIDVGPVTHDVNKRTALHYGTVKHQDYKPLKVVLYPNGKTNSISCKVKVTGHSAKVVNGTWKAFTTSEVVDIAGSSGVVAQTQNTYFRLTDLEVTDPPAGWQHTLVDNKLPEGRLNGINIQFEWVDPVPLWAPYSPDFFPGSETLHPHIQHSLGAFWVGLWERAQFLNLLKWTAPEGVNRPSRALTPHEAEPDVGSYYDVTRTTWATEWEFYFDYLDGWGQVPSCDWVPDTSSTTDRDSTKAAYPEFEYQADQTCIESDFRHGAQGPYAWTISDFENTRPLHQPIMQLNWLTPQLAATVEPFLLYEKYGGWLWREQSVWVDADPDGLDIIYSYLASWDVGTLMDSWFQVFSADQQQLTQGKALASKVVQADIITGFNPWAPSPAAHTTVLYDEHDVDPGNWLKEKESHSPWVTYQNRKNWFVMKWNYTFHE